MIGEEKVLGENIRKYRVLAGLSQDDLASKMRMSRAVLSQWENDQDDPNEEQLARLAKNLGISADMLLADEPLSGTDRIEKLDSAKGSLGTSAKKLENVQTRFSNLVERQISYYQMQVKRKKQKRRKIISACCIILGGIVVMILIFLAFLYWINAVHDTDHPSTGPVRIVDLDGND
ncbi:MAG: helix-turn-helix domain-containing protein [Clostridiales bacterium]|nr:helix-turn-helix domain-containing protein [Clostridiales bacterium]